MNIACEPLPLQPVIASNAYMDKSVVVPPWVAYRIYEPTAEECKVVISNERGREFLVLDDAAARLWAWIARNPGTSLSAMGDALSYPTAEMADFVSELVSIGLLRRGDTARVEASSPLVADEVPIASKAVTDQEAEFAVQDWALERGYLWAALWELTYRCNEKCLHCFNPGASHDHGERGNRRTDELSATEWRSMLDELREIGVFRLTLTGGEALLRKDFFEILEAARHMGFSVSLMTNGLLLDDEARQHIAAAYPHRVEFSVYSHVAERHDAVTGVPGSFDKTLDAAVWLRQMGVSVTLKMVAMRDTIGDIDGFRQLGKDIDCETMIDMTVSAGLDGARDPLTKMVASNLDLIRAVMTPGNPLYVGTPESPNSRSSYSDPDQRPCGAGHATLSITPEGKIYPCNGLPISVGTVRDEGVRQIWREAQAARKAGKVSRLEGNRLAAWQSVTLADFAGCDRYARCIWCQKCASFSMLETGDELAPAPSKCRNAAARRVAHDYLGKGGSPESFDEEALERYRQCFPEELHLWRYSETQATTIDLESVRDVLRERGKISALTKNSIPEDTPA